MNQTHAQLHPDNNEDDGHWPRSNVHTHRTSHRDSIWCPYGTEQGETKKPFLLTPQDMNFPDMFRSKLGPCVRWSVFRNPSILNEVEVF